MMWHKEFLTGYMVGLLLSWSDCEDFQRSSDRLQRHDLDNTTTRPHLRRVSLHRTPYNIRDDGILVSLLPNETTTATRHTLARRQTFADDEVTWSNINAQVDLVIGHLVAYLHNVQIKYFVLPDVVEDIVVPSLIFDYGTRLRLTNGIVYNVAKVQRLGNAYMTYRDKAFVCRFLLIIKTLQFEYDFALKFTIVEGYGRVIGSLEDTIIYGDLSVNVLDTRLHLNDFRVKKFGNIRVQLDQQRIIRELSGAILSPITNVFKDRITTSISDGLKEQMQLVLDDFNDKDSLQLKNFSRKMLAGLTGR